MAQYAEVDLLNGETHAPKPGMPKRRMAAVVLGVMAVMGLVGVGRQLHQAANPPLSNLHIARKALLAAFSQRSLKVAEEMRTSSIEFVFAPEGAEEPGAMEIEAKVVKAAEAANMSVEFAFKALEGKGDDLKSSFDAVMEHMKAPENMVSTKAEGDMVTVTMIPPPELAVEMGDDMEDEIPELNATLKLGETFEGLYNATEDDDNIETRMPFSFKGISAKLDAAWAVGMIAAAEAFEKQAGGIPGVEFDMMQLVSMLAFKTELRYKDPKKMADLFGKHLPPGLQALPTLPKLKKQAKRMFGGAPRVVKGAFKDAAKYADGLDSVTIRGLPQKRELVAKTKGVHLTPVLADLVA